MAGSASSLTVEGEVNMVFRPAVFRRRDRGHLLTHFLSWVPDKLIWEEVGHEGYNQRQSRRAGIPHLKSSMKTLGGTDEEEKEGLSMFVDKGAPPLQPHEVAEKLLSIDPYRHLEDEAEKNLIRIASFDSIGSVANEPVPALKTVCCFLADHSASKEVPFIDPAVVIDKVLDHLKGSNGTLDFSMIFSEEQLVPVNKWVKKYGTGANARFASGVPYRELSVGVDSDRLDHEVLDQPDSPTASTSSAYTPVHTTLTTNQPPPVPQHVRKKMKLRSKKSNVVSQRVYEDFMEVVRSLDLLKLGHDEFTQLVTLFRGAVDLCPVSAMSTLSEEELATVEQCISGMSSIRSSCAQRTDLSEMASNFASAVIGACFLVVERVLPETNPIPIPDILDQHDKLSETEVARYNDENVSYRDALEAHAKRVKEEMGELSEEAQKFSEKNFAVIDDTVPTWVLDLVEEVVTKRRMLQKGKVNRIGQLIWQPVFQHYVNNQGTMDRFRKLIDCGEDWILYNLISFPVSQKLEGHGFLTTPDSSKKRVANVVSFIESTVDAKSKRPKEERDQSWHTDFSSELAKFFGDEFGISVLVGASEGSEVHVIAETFGLESTDELRKRVFRGKVEKIFLKRGQCLVMGPGCRHKGVGYDKRNARLFLAFLVGRSRGASFGSTYNLDDLSDEKFFVGIVRQMFKRLNVH